MMVTTRSTSTCRVALIGNPNTGKSTLFSALSGLHQRVGNYPGVTVEKKIGQLRIDDQEIELVDLPGAYSLAPHSPDEMVALRVLLGWEGGDPPEIVICVVDANNLERNLFLVTQVLELGCQVILALNMLDIAKRNGIRIDSRLLSERLRVPVVELQANKRVGLAELQQTIRQLASLEDDETPKTPQRNGSPELFPSVMSREINVIASQLDGGQSSSFIALRLLLDGSGLVQESLADSRLAGEVAACRQRLVDAGVHLAAVESIARYKHIEKILDSVVKRPSSRAITNSDRIDRILTHKVWGSLIFVAVMIFVFQSIFSWALPIMDGIDLAVSKLSEIASSQLSAGAVRSLVTDGILAGVGGVIVFLPQIFILFFFIGLLEDCGYMARAAYLMDKLMSKIGLSGKSFIPLLSSFACAIPGIMATRVIENRRDRFITILIAPLMACSARLPVYVLLIAAFVPDSSFFGGWLGVQGLTMFALYLLGVIVAMIVAWALRTTVFRGDAPPFVMELPDYKFPSLSTVLSRMLERGWAFIKRAGTLIFAVSVVIWALAYFPHPPHIERTIRGEHAERLAELQLAADEISDRPRGTAARQLDEYRSAIDAEIGGAYIRQSFLGRCGRVIEPLVRPLGWDWRIASAVVASFPAREVVVGTLGVLYSVGGDEDESSVPLRQKLQNATWDGSDQKVFNLPVALSLMVFFALCAQCVSTLVIMARETGSWRWPAFAFAYMTSLAYLGALITYQVGTRLSNLS